MRHLPLLLCCCLAFFASPGRAAPRVPVTEAWGDLLGTPPLRAGTNWVRLGVQAKAGQPGDSVLIYALFEGATRPGPPPAGSGSQLGPLEVRPLGELCQLSKALEQLERIQRLPPDALNVLYATELRFPRRGSARFEVRAGREVVARLTLTAKGRAAQPWFVAREPLGEREALAVEGLTDLRLSTAQAVARWPGDEPLLWETTQVLIPLARLLPTATPRSPTLGVRLLPGGALELSCERGLGNLPEHLLARVWIRGRPCDLLRTERQIEDRAGLQRKLERRARVRLDLDLESLGATEGDQVELQLLYAPRGVRYAGRGAEALRSLDPGRPAVSRRLVLRAGRVDPPERVLQSQPGWKRTGGHPCVRLLRDDSLAIEREPMSQVPALPQRIYSSSRFTFGNFFFPDKLVLNADHVMFRKSHLIGGEEESIRYEQIASVSLQSGVLFADLLFETTGGSEPVFLNGLWKGTASKAKAELQARIRSHTSAKPDPVVAALERQTQVLEAILGELQRR